MNEMVTPVLFLVFNRPETTEQVFGEIRKARPPRLYVAADGPRSGVPGEHELCMQVRSVVGRVDWPCTVATLFREGNLGCKHAVSSALDWFFEHEREGIILEDDCLPGQSFFHFCENLLEKYRNDERVAMISGTNHLLDEFVLEESYVFSRYYNIWGWASWRRVWDNYDITMQGWYQRKTDHVLDKYYPQKHVREYFMRAFDQAFENKLDTWDIQFAYSCLFSGGLSVVPKVNLISNIGAIGTHSAKTSPNNFTPVFTLDVQNLTHPGEVAENQLFDDLLFERQFRKSLGERAVLQSKHLLHIIKRLRKRSN